MGNPKRHRKHHGRRRTRARRHTSIMSNPLSVTKTVLAQPKEMLTASFAVDAGSVAAGYMLPQLAMGYLPYSFRDTPLKTYGVKVAAVAGLSVLGNAVGGKRVGRMVLVGGGLMLLMDLWNDFVAPRLSGASATAPAGSGTEGLGYWFGDNGLGHYFGPDGAGQSTPIGSEPVQVGESVMVDGGNW